MLVSTLKRALTVCHVAEVMSGKSGSVPELKTFFGLTLNTGYVKKPNLELVSFCPDWSSLSERWVLSGTKFFFLNDDFNCALFWGVWRSQWSSKSGRSVIQSPAPPMSNCFQARCWWPSCTFPFSSNLPEIVIPWMKQMNQPLKLIILLLWGPNWKVKEGVSGLQWPSG